MINRIVCVLNNKNQGVKLIKEIGCRMATVVLYIVGEFAKFFADSRCKGRAFEPEIPEELKQII